MPDLTLETFTQWLGESFAVERGGESPYAIELVEAKGVAGDSTSREPFSLLFRGTSEVILPQQIHTLHRQGAEALEIFLVPLGPDPKEPETILYEAVFS